MVAAPARLRPILMTTMTAIVGLLPMVFANGSGTELTNDLSIVSVGGMAFATVITLLFIPVMYSIFEESSVKRQQRKANKAQSPNIQA
jgi:HAE1 family hydrophobic/amphiphilic exporter-1